MTPPLSRESLKREPYRVPDTARRSAQSEIQRDLDLSDEGNNAAPARLVQQGPGWAFLTINRVRNGRYALNGPTHHQEVTMAQAVSTITRRSAVAGLALTAAPIAVLAGVNGASAQPCVEAERLSSRI